MIIMKIVMNIMKSWFLKKKWKLIFSPLLVPIEENRRDCDFLSLSHGPTPYCHERFAIS